MAKPLRLASFPKLFGIEVGIMPLAPQHFFPLCHFHSLFKFSKLYGKIWFMQLMKKTVYQIEKFDANASMMKKDRPVAKKSLGQHFLRVEGICKKIIALLDLREGDNILEIGPGSGALTRFLENAPHATLLLLEKDEYWAKWHEKNARARVLGMDAMKFSWQNLEGQWKIIGNLPYNVASPLIWNILCQCLSLKKAVFMVQKEVGQRLAALPGSRKYGALSIWAQSYAKIGYEFDVGPACFTPAPRVESAVLTFEPVEKSLRPACPSALATIVKMCFQNRRKQLGNIFKNYPSLLKAAEELNIKLSLRPENLDVRTFNQLACLCRENFSGF